MTGGGGALAETRIGQSLNQGFLRRFSFLALSTIPTTCLKSSDSRSGSFGERPNANFALMRLLKAVARRDVDMVAAWSVDRLGRSLVDLLDFLRELHAKGVDLFLHQQGLDTSTPSGRAMFQMLGVFAEFERAMIRERVMAGLSRAKADGTQLGRRRLEDSDADKVAAIVAARAEGTGIRRIARELGVGVGTVLRVTGEVA